MLRLNTLEIATNLTLAAYKEPVDVLLEPPKLQLYYSKTELSDNIKSK